MLSNFGRADGGRETWAYVFIPRLLERFQDLRLDVYGLSIEGQPNNREVLRETLPDTARKRVTMELIQASASWLPKALTFWRKLPKLPGRHPPPSFVLAVGSWVELLASLRAPQFRGSAKIAWLRTIFADEKAHRYPRFLRPLLERAETAVLRRADLLIANGEDTAAHYRARGLEVTVIPNAVDLARWRMPTPALSSPIAVAFVGRLAPVKGIGEFVEVARRSSGVLKFLVVGDGPERPRVERAAADGVLEYKGALANELMPELLLDVDVCVALGFAGLQSGGGAGISNALIEQAAAGRVLVCWDNNAYRQVVDESNAYLVPQGDVDSLAATFMRIDAEPSNARRRAEEAARTAARYGIDRHMDEFVAAAGKWLPMTSGAPPEKLDVQLR